MKNKVLKWRMVPGCFYVWVGGSCDYGRPERTGGGAYILQQDDRTLDCYTVSALHTTEFRMMLTVMVHAMELLPEGADLVFLTNVAYLQNFDRLPSANGANADLIAQCVEAKRRLGRVEVRLLSYHKYAELPRTHEMARRAMADRRECPGNA